MADITFYRASKPLHGAVRVPADKSITHRALILASIANGITRVQNYLDSETTRATLDCMRALGADIQAGDADTLVIHGKGLHGLTEPRDVLWCLGSGTTIRLLAGLCAGQHFLSVLDGTPALKRRPMARIVEPLKRMGATVLARDNDRFPPLVFRGGTLRGIEYALPVASAQVKSAILLAGLYADSRTTVHEPAPSRDHSERMLRAFGVNVEPVSPTIARLNPPAALTTPGELTIPGDFSSAAFFMVAGLLVPGSELVLENVGVNPGRTGLRDALARMGAEVQADEVREVNGEPVSALRVCAAGLRGTTVQGDEIPRMIDEFPIFAVAATQADGQTVVRDAAELRVKESDRVATVAQELRKMGAQIEEREDGFVVTGSARLRGARVNAHNDHRLAMALAVAALVAEGETVIEGWECVADSFPNFADCLDRLVG